VPLPRRPGPQALQRLVDVGVPVLLAVLTGPAALRGLGAGAAAWFVALHVAIVFRRAAPVRIFVAAYAIAVLGGVVLSNVRVQGPYPELQLALLLYTVARHSSRLWTTAVVASVVTPATVVFIAAGPEWPPLAFILLLVLATVSLGITIRTRQAYLAELEERAVRLERERDQQGQIVAAGERARIARDMHDVVAHNLAVMIALADGAALTAATRPERAADAMAHVAETGRQALGEMRRLLGVLHEDDVGTAPQPGLADVEALVAQVRTAGLPVTLTVTGTPGDWGPGVGLAVYRIVQEALTNTLKHAGPDVVAEVTLVYDADGVTATVLDDGRATATATATATGDGRGLAGMTERAATYGGELSAGPRTDGAGWRVRARLRPAEGVS
jgi:signal transduction histidine kinase